MGCCKRWLRRCFMGECNLNCKLRSARILIFPFFRGIEDDDEHSWAIMFYIYYANEHVEFRRYVHGTSIRRLHMVTATHMQYDVLDWSYYALTVASRMPWMIPALLEIDLCNLSFRIIECVVNFVAFRL